MILNNKFINALAYVFLLFVFGLCFTHPIDRYWDVICADEIIYLKYGKNLFNEVRFDWGFLYNVWYKFLSVLQNSSVPLYYLNYRVLMTLIPVFLFTCLFIYGVPSFVAFIISFLYLISKLHVTTWPFVSDFCIVLMLLYFISVKYVKDSGWQAVLLSFTCALLYLTRPEYLISFVLSLLLSLYLNRNHKKRYVLLLGLCSLLIFVIVKTPKLTENVDRPLFAYFQHYFLTYTIWHKSTPVSVEGYFELAPKIFGNSYTFIGSILHNPLAFFTHVLTCTGFYIASLLKSIEDIFVPSIYFHFLGKFRHLLFLLIVVLLFKVFYKNRRNYLVYVIDNNLKYGIVIFLAGGCISNFVIGYNLHYLQLHFILYILFLSVLLFKDISVIISKYVQIICCIILFLILPAIKNYKFENPDYLEARNLPLQKLAAYINKTNDHKNHYIIAHQTCIHYIFDGDNFKSIECYSIRGPFLQFVSKNNVDYIYITKQLIEDTKLNKDAEWKIFIAHPEKYNFYKQTIPGTSNYLLMKK